MLILAVATTAVVVTAVGGAQTPTEVPFPSPKVVQYFVSTQTVSSTGALSNYFPRGSAVTFRAFAAESKTGNIVDDQAAKYFYVAIPGQPNVKLTYTDPETKRPPVPWQWTATWTIPADHPLGLVQFKVLLKSKTKQYGSFVQIPVVTSQLTVTKG
ncbi:MAG: hypothetical protein A2Y55_11340 [Actinobacteria bacterium RBG_16_68_12]|nr:MAG: hypothetical protein A2Y55_11340 [Actinobacteria bacterium RBG_16_68_12]